MKRMVWFALMVVLSGCFLKQTDPQAAAPKKAQFEGIAIVQEVSNNQGVIGQVLAAFTPPKASKKTRTAQALYTAPVAPFSELRLLSLFGGRGPECVKEQVEIAKEKKDTRKTTDRISVGKVGFGAVLQKNIAVLKEEEDHLYSGLSNGMPPGVYQILGEGTKDVDAFAEAISMPEEMHHLRVYGYEFGDPRLALQPSKGMEMIWKDPQAPNSESQMLFRATVINDGTLTALTCVAFEDGIPSVKGFKTWNLDRAWFAEFPESGDADFALSRVHDSSVDRKNRYKMRLQGRRTYYTALDLDE